MRGTYDRSVDVLYLFIRQGEDVEGEDLDRGLELDFSLEDGTPVGVTVLGYYRNGWSSRVGDLAEIASAHLSSSRSEVEALIRRIA
jgi:uncharacterized protein YuzE